MAGSYDDKADDKEGPHTPGAEALLQMRWSHCVLCLALVLLACR